MEVSRKDRVVRDVTENTYIKCVCRWKTKQTKGILKL